MSLLDIQNLTVQFGGLKAISNVNLSLDAGQMVGLIGPNGAGKTTLFNTVTGVVQKTEGSVLFDGKDLSKYKPNQIAHLGISRTFQNIRLFSKMTAIVLLIMESFLHFLGFRMLEEKIARQRKKRRNISTA